jgi:hypothetical protein
VGFCLGFLLAAILSASRPGEVADRASGLEAEPQASQTGSAVSEIQPRAPPAARGLQREDDTQMRA